MDFLSPSDVFTARPSCAPRVRTSGNLATLIRLMTPFRLVTLGPNCPTTNRLPFVKYPRTPWAIQFRKGGS